MVMSLPVNVLGPLLLILVASPAAGQVPAGNGGDGYRAAVAAAAREVGRQLELLQDTIINEPSARQGRGLLSQADKASLNLVFLQRQLKQGATAADLAQAFEQLDSRVQALVSEIAFLGPEERTLKRAAARVQAAENDLHFAIFGGGGGDTRRAQVLVRQVLALRGAAADLEQVAKYLLEDQDSWADFANDFRGLRRATAAFQQRAEGKADREQLRKAFARVQQAWAELAVDYQGLPATSSILLQNKATRLDAIYGRLYGLMGLKGYRPSLVAGP
jgi:hypothetical protein